MLDFLKLLLVGVALAFSLGARAATLDAIAFKNDEGFIRPNCKATSHQSEISGNIFAFRTIPTTSLAEEELDRGLPLAHCLDHLRLGILSHIGEPDGSIRMDDHGTVEFGEKGALTQCTFRIQKTDRIPEDLMKRILKYEGALPREAQDDPLENFSPEKIHDWSKAVEDVVIIDCFVS